MVEQLLDRGISPNLEGEKIPIVEATLQNDLTSLRLLLEFGADPNLKPADGNPALRYACQYGYEEAAKLLLSYGADPNIKSKLFNFWTFSMRMLQGISFSSRLSFNEFHVVFTYFRHPFDIS